MARLFILQELQALVVEVNEEMFFLPLVPLVVEEYTRVVQLIQVVAQVQVLMLRPLPVGLHGMEQVVQALLLFNTQIHIQVLQGVQLLRCQDVRLNILLMQQAAL